MREGKIENKGERGRKEKVKESGERRREGRRCIGNPCHAPPVEKNLSLDEIMLCAAGLLLP